MINTDKTMIELQKIKEECSLRYLSQTPEEQRREAQETREWFEKAIGRKIETVDYSKRNKAAREELAQV